jgi:hypothetical protein
MVRIADIILRCTLAGVASVLVGTVLLIFSIVVSLPVALAAAGFTLLVVLGVWVALPSLAHPRRRR